jgi:predicted acetyltransferase
MLELTFRRPAKDLSSAFKAFLDAFTADDHDMWPADCVFGLARTDFNAYVEWLQQSAEGRGLPAGWVPAETYWAFAGDEMAGEIHVRHHVRGSLFRIGGHAGYSVQPKFRRQGVASAMLRHACARLRELGEVDALITCWDDNTASAGVVEKCGGARMPDAIVDSRIMRRYLIPLDKA